MINVASAAAQVRVTVVLVSAVTAMLVVAAMVVGVVAVMSFVHSPATSTSLTFTGTSLPTSRSDLD
jgi:hypothetical protein